MRLRDLVLAAGLLIPGCHTPSEPVPRHQAEQTVDNVVKDALEYFQNKEYAKTQGLLEQHRDYQVKQNKDLDAPARCLLALTYTMNWKLGDAETQFWIVMHEYKRNTYLADQVGTEFSEFFKTQQYRNLEKMLKGYAGSYPRLNGVLGFLKTAQKDYTSASEHYGKAVPYFSDDLVNEFKTAFLSRNQLSASQNDQQTATGYLIMLEAINATATVKR